MLSVVEGGGANGIWDAGELPTGSGQPPHKELSGEDVANAEVEKLCYRRT